MATVSKTLKRKFTNISTVTLFVGPKKTAFITHKDQLCEVSPFFKAAFTSEFKESSEERNELPEDDADAVELFVQWLYTQKCEDFLHADTGEEEDDDHLMIAAKFLVFTDKYDIQDCKKYVIEAILAKARSPDRLSAPDHMAIKHIYHYTSHGSGLRSLIVDWYAWNVVSWWLSESRQRNWLLELPEFAIDLLIAHAEVAESDEDQYPFQTKSSEEYMRSHTIPDPETNSENQPREGQ